MDIHTNNLTSSSLENPEGTIPLTQNTGWDGNIQWLHDIHELLVLASSTQSAHTGLGRLGLRFSIIHLRERLQNGPTSSPPNIVDVAGLTIMVPSSFICRELLAQMASPMDASLAQQCPACDGQSMVTSQTEYGVEHFGAVLLSVSRCGRCGYRHSDVTTLTNREPVELRIEVRSVEDLSIRVIKSGTATVSIPEFGATITPAQYSEGYISNVEGILGKIEDALTFMLNTATGQRLKMGEAMLRRMRAARDSKPRFTLIIKDPLGNSAIVSSNPERVGKRNLTHRELQKIKFGQYAAPSENMER